MEELKEIPQPKFFDGQIVTTNEKHFSQHQVIILIRPGYIENKGWYYGNLYCHYKDGQIIVGGGISYSWKEEDFSEITEPKIKVACDIFYKEKEKADILSKLDKINDELSKLNTVRDYLKELQ